MSGTAEILNHHLETFGNGDLDGILSDYDESSVLFTPDGPLKGLDSLRVFFSALLEEFGKPGMSIEMLRQDVEGDCAYIVWTAETADNVYDVASDTFVVRDGTIAYQSLAAKIVPKS